MITKEQVISAVKKNKRLLVVVSPTDVSFVNVESGEVKVKVGYLDFPIIGNPDNILLTGEDHLGLNEKECFAEALEAINRYFARKEGGGCCLTYKKC